MKSSIFRFITIIIIVSILTSCKSSYDKNIDILVDTYKQNAILYDIEFNSDELRKIIDEKVNSQSILLGMSKENLLQSLINDMHNNEEDYNIINIK